MELPLGLLLKRLPKSELCVVTLAQAAKDNSGRNAFTKTKGKNDWSVLFPPEPEM
jgi:hypothetical protein